MKSSLLTLLIICSSLALVQQINTQKEKVANFARKIFASRGSSSDSQKNNYIITAYDTQGNPIYQQVTGSVSVEEESSEGDSEQEYQVYLNQAQRSPTPAASHYLTNPEFNQKYSIGSLEANYMQSNPEQAAVMVPTPLSGGSLSQSPGIGDLLLQTQQVAFVHPQEAGTLLAEDNEQKIEGVYTSSKMQAMQFQQPYQHSSRVVYATKNQLQELSKSNGRISDLIDKKPSQSLSTIDEKRVLENRQKRKVQHANKSSKVFTSSTSWKHRFYPKPNPQVILPTNNSYQHFPASTSFQVATPSVNSQSQPYLITSQTPSGGYTFGVSPSDALQEANINQQMTFRTTHDLRYPGANIGYFASTFKDTNVTPSTQMFMQPGLYPQATQIFQPQNPYLVQKMPMQNNMSTRHRKHNLRVPDPYMQSSSTESNLFEASRTASYTNNPFFRAYVKEKTRGDKYKKRAIRYRNQRNEEKSKSEMMKMEMLKRAHEPVSSPSVQNFVATWRNWNTQQQGQWWQSFLTTPVTSGNLVRVSDGIWCPNNQKLFMHMYQTWSLQPLVWQLNLKPAYGCHFNIV